MVESSGIGCRTHKIGSGRKNGREGMTSTGMMVFLVVFYLATALVSGMEANWPRVLYWISAAGITTAVLWGAK